MPTWLLFRQLAVLQVNSAAALASGSFVCEFGNCSGEKATSIFCDRVILAVQSKHSDYSPTETILCRLVSSFLDTALQLSFQRVTDDATASEETDAPRSMAEVENLQSPYDSAMISGDNVIPLERGKLLNLAA